MAFNCPLALELNKNFGEAACLAFANIYLEMKVEDHDPLINPYMAKMLSYSILRNGDETLSFEL
ncbi:hypothetical protein T07_4705 [Trichinella nelsoni]|uniref:Uncharacterized protein n=1 Tax=Trichinella nelsoni TaxID=6336 RepID=A0A0V0RWF7_9BILA|nr:hypothetical protein T07_4705 [Trichinella nelsoni]